MRFSVVALVLAASSFAAAQTSSTSCTAKVILERCLEDTKPQVATCVSNDYECLCDREKAVLTCYNNCPNDNGIHAQQATVTSLCNAAKQVADSNSRASEALASTKTTSSGSTKTSASSSSTPTESDSTESEDSSEKSDEKSSSSDSAAAPTGVQKLFVAAAAIAAVAVL